MSRRPTRAEFAAYAADSDKQAARYDEAARDADQAAKEARSPLVRDQCRAMGRLHRQHAAEAREDSVAYRDGRMPGDDW